MRVPSAVPSRGRPSRYQRQVETSVSCTEQVRLRGWPKVTFWEVREEERIGGTGREGRRGEGKGGEVKEEGAGEKAGKEGGEIIHIRRK